MDYIKNKTMKLAIVKQLACGAHSVLVNGRSVVPYFRDKEEAMEICASRLKKLKKDLTIIRIPFLKIWVVW